MAISWIITKKNTVGEKYRWGKYCLGKIPLGKNTVGEKYCLGKLLLGKILSGKIIIELEILLLCVYN